MEKEVIVYKKEYSIQLKNILRIIKVGKVLNKQGQQYNGNHNNKMLFPNFVTNFTF